MPKRARDDETVKRWARWTEEEDVVLREWTGKATEIVLPGRAYTAIRTRMVMLGRTTKHVPWSYEEDTALREAPREDETRMAFYTRVFPKRSYFNAHHRYETYIAPMLGLGRKSKLTTRLVNHLKLARTPEERENLEAYYAARHNSAR